MIEVADVFRRFAADYVSAHGASMLPSHRRAIEDILDRRTAALGGQVWRCETCNNELFSYLESPGFAENFGSCGEVEGLHLVGVLTFGDEFREDVGLVGI